MRKIAALFTVLILAAPVKADGEITLADAWSPSAGVVKGDGGYAGPPPAGWTYQISIEAKVGAVIYSSGTLSGGNLWSGTITGIPSGSVATVYAELRTYKNGVLQSKYTSNTKTVTVQ